MRALKIGDLLVAVPALRGLRAGFPDHRIVLACAGWLRPLVELTGAVDEILPTPRGLDEPLALAPGTVDVAVNLHGNGVQSRGRLEALEARRRIGHAAPGWDGPEWIDGLHERERWSRLLNAHGLPGDPLDYLLPPPDTDVVGVGGGAGSAVVHVGAAHASRHWPVGRFARVVEDLLRRGLRVLLTGDQRERERAVEVATQVDTSVGRSGARLAVLAGELSLTEFFAVIAGADLVVSADTGAAHLASAFARPSVVIFGPAAPENWGPPPGPHRVLTDSAVRRGDPFAADPDPALLAVGVDDVLREVDQLLPGS
ncbi:heptosyltransferase family protein [Corynebacterium halotolerans YIM 70093 = DSM 44683]|uniref:Heptosyltransferase family protein n=1 Tax=Corynebacterium halotolerans YIM 70093 = DSM 44683 TaxID=1121362 RepID=M1NRI8_9CORY|nr:heptosyltransferase family protein [Corynebacterium halotolerans YIM 70093 = DSM 44683]